MPGHYTKVSLSIVNTETTLRKEGKNLIQFYGLALCRKLVSPNSALFTCTHT
jgi:hypothetical protein